MQAFPKLESEACDRQARALIEALVAGAARDGEAPLDVLAAHQVPAPAVAEAVASHAPELAASPAWTAALEADSRRAERLERARVLTEAALADLDGRVALPASSFGPLWQHDVDVIVATATLREAAARLREAGFLDVQPLLERIGRATPDVHRLAAHENGEVLGATELCTRLHDYGPVADAAIARAVAGTTGLRRLAGIDVVRRRCAKVAAARRPTVRGAVELLALLSRGEPVPVERDVAAAFLRCAELERELVGPGPLSEAATRFERRPNLTWARARVSRRGRAVGRRVRPARLPVAFSGIDGAGKTTQAARLVENLGRMEVPARAVWLRMGYGDSSALKTAARFGRRLLPAGSGGAMVARAGGAPPDAHATRRGPLGWVWALAVTVNFVWLARGNVRRARGSVLVNDRALPDALVGLREGWGGSVDLSLQARLLERFGPEPALTFYMRIDPAVALGRKQDIFAGKVLEEHAKAYDRLLLSRPGTITLEAEDPLEEISLEVLRIVCGQGAVAPAGMVA